MAETLVGTGYDKSIGTRTGAGGVTEFYNKQSGMGFENPQMLANYVQAQYQNNSVNSGNIFDVLKAGVTPSANSLNPNVNASEAADALDGSKSSTLSSSMKGLPTLDQLMLDAQNYRNQILGLSTPSQDELAARQGVNNANNLLRNFELSYEGGLQNIMKKPIALEFQQGQAAAMTRDAAFTRSSLARGVDVANQTLTTLQNARFELLDKLNTAYGFGQNDIATRMKLDEIERAEQQAAKEFALNYNIHAPAYMSPNGKTVYNSTTGRPYTNEQDFFRDFGFTSWDEVPAGFIQTELISDQERLAERDYQRGVFESDRTFNRGVQEFDQNYALRLRELAQKQQATDAEGNPITFDPNTGMYSGSSSSYSGLYGGAVGMGSPLWGAGADIDLKKGDPVYSPVTGQVVFAGENGGFGNQVKIKTSDGNEVWLSHLDSGAVKVGDTVSAGQVIGVGGNTGDVIPGPNGDGSHLDLTVKTAAGKFMTPQQAVQYADQQFSQRTKYASEFEARADYNTDMDVLTKAKQAYDSGQGDPLPAPSQIISDMIKEYGSFISRQEIEGTIFKLFNQQRPTQQTNTQQSRPGPAGGSTQQYTSEWAELWKVPADAVTRFFTGR